MLNLDYILDLISKGENQELEFKLNFGAKAIVAINALANTQGGYVLLGVSDKKEIKGVDANKESLQEWLNEIKQKTSPSASVTIQDFNVQNKTIIAFKVSEAPIKPVALKGRYYIRRANSNHLLSADEIVNLRIESMNESFDAFAVNTKVDDLNKEALQHFFKNIKESGRFNPTGNITGDLNKLGLIKDNKLTRAAELLFGTHHTAIHIGRFKSAATIIDDSLIKQPLVLAVNEVMNFIKRNIRIEYEFTGELSRKEKWQFPLQVVRELLLNAIIHKDYRNPTDVIIKIFDDSILFSNPGNFFGNITIESLNTDNYQPRHRNKLLAEAFYLMGEVEKYGTGFVRIRKWLQDYPNLEYQIEDLGDFIRVLLTESRQKEKIMKDDPVNDPVSDPVSDPVNDRQNQIIQFIRKDKNITRKALAAKCGISVETIKRDIRKLKEMGLLKRMGSDKTGYWEVIIK